MAADPAYQFSHHFITFARNISFFLNRRSQLRLRNTQLELCFGAALHLWQIRGQKVCQIFRNLSRGRYRNVVLNINRTPISQVTQSKSAQPSRISAVKYPSQRVLLHPSLKPIENFAEYFLSSHSIKQYCTRPDP